MNKEELYTQWETEFYDKHADEDGLSEMDFEAIAVGFFIAKGLTVDEAFQMYRYCVEKGKF